MAASKRATSMEIAYRKTVEKIINERLQPGTPLREEHLAAEFNLSPTPVREAFRRLENEGWVQSFPYRGSFLRIYSPEEIEVLFTIREITEGAAVRLAAVNATAADMAEIRQSLETERQYIEKCRDSGVVIPTYQEDISLHNTLVKAAHSGQLIQRCSLIQRQVDFFCLYRNKATLKLDDLQMVYTEHSMIVEAMCRGWADIAEQLMRRHISDAARKIIAGIKARAAGGDDERK